MTQFPLLGVQRLLQNPAPDILTPTPVLVRTARPEDFAAVGDFLVRAFVGGGFTSEDGAERLREVAPRATPMGLPRP
jgi:hypothetical protein